MFLGAVAHTDSCLSLSPSRQSLHFRETRGSIELSFAVDGGTSGVWVWELLWEQNPGIPSTGVSVQRGRFPSKSRRLAVKGRCCRCVVFSLSLMVLTERLCVCV